MALERINNGNNSKMILFVKDLLFLKRSCKIKNNTKNEVKVFVISRIKIY